MSSSAATFLAVLSTIALLLAGTALVSSQRTGTPSAVEPRTLVAREASESPDPSELEREISELRAQVQTLTTRLEAMEGRAAGGNPVATGASEVGVVAPDRSAPLDDRIAAVVDAVLEDRGVDLIARAGRVAKTEEARDSMSRWVRSRAERLPTLLEKLATVDLAPQTAREVEEIFEANFAAMVSLTEELYADPPPSPEESFEIMGEVKETAASLVARLDEVLTPEEMIQVGQVTVDSELPRLGHGFIEAGQSDAEAGDGAVD